MFGSIRTGVYGNAPLMQHPEKYQDSAMGDCWLLTRLDPHICAVMLTAADRFSSFIG
jgi:hypothetical protein